jgi:hypothetical protein
MLDSNRNAFSDASQISHFISFDCRDRRIYSAQQKRTCQSHMLDGFADDTRLKRSNVGGYVGKFGHAVNKAVNRLFGEIIAS